MKYLLANFTSKSIFKSTLIILLGVLVNFGYAQSYIAGETYFDSTGFVEYRAGNLPIILSAPHGGNWSPDSIPDRDCSGCSYAMDSYTRVITWGLYDAFFEQTGCYPHMIMNRLHRVKFDANRDIDDAADGNPLVEQAWHGYHTFIDQAKTQVANNYGRGLFLDIHGHAHTIQRIELGYLLSRSELQLSDDVLNSDAYIEESSIRTLEGDNILDLTHSELLRGSDSFGTLLDEKGFPSVPSSTDPFPNDNEAYFSGGYNTVRHGSRDNEAEIDAIQIELNQDIRFDDSTREILIDSLTTSTIEYINRHYNNQFTANFCNLVTAIPNEDSKEFDFTLYPNPAMNFIVVGNDARVMEVCIFNNLGQKMLSQKTSYQEQINIDHLPTGYYLVQLRKEGVLLGLGKLIKK